MDFYVYVIFRPNGVPCYVGKGRGNRWRSHVWNKNNLHLMRIYALGGGVLPVIKICENLSEDEANVAERCWIAALGRESKGGLLVNLTDGGDGKSGYIVSVQTRQKIGQSNSGKTASQQTRDKMSKSSRGRRKTAEHAKNISVAAIARLSTVEARQKASEAAFLRWQTRNREELSEKLKRYHSSMNEEQRKLRSNAISSATKLAMSNSLVRAKISESRSKRKR